MLLQPPLRVRLAAACMVLAAALSPLAPARAEPPGGSASNGPATAAPIDAVGAALQASAAVLNDREYSRQRQAIVAASEELRERELIKMATLTSAIAEALRRRGVKEPTASLTAEAGIAVFRVAFARWVDPANRKELGGLMTESLDQLRVAISA